MDVSCATMIRGMTSPWHRQQFPPMGEVVEYTSHPMRLRRHRLRDCRTALLPHLLGRVRDFEIGGLCKRNWWFGERFGSDGWMGSTREWS
mmetsp:Transcript_45576/g.46016  ORF Transcript_45576/g.46016 Transcript_45576/m.46016 type:complete len:90 (-) Transcript_45576:200-469(-)